MGLFEQDTGCCGANFQKNNISLLGLLTLSLPLLLTLGPFYLLFKLVPSYKKSKFNVLSIIVQANLKLIEQRPILPKLKCFIVGKLFNVSPVISGAIFKSFNFLVLTLSWGIILMCFSVVRETWP